MQELKLLANHRYLLKYEKSQKNLAIVEAKSILQAKARALQLSETTNLIDKNQKIEVVEVSTAMQLPTFLDAYFILFNESAISTKH